MYVCRFIGIYIGEASWQLQTGWKLRRSEDGVRGEGEVEGRNRPDERKLRGPYAKYAEGRETECIFFRRKLDSIHFLPV